MPEKASSPENNKPLEPARESPASDAPRGILPKEIGGPSGPEPTRFGDWEKNGRCIDF